MDFELKWAEGRPELESVKKPDNKDREKREYLKALAFSCHEYTKNRLREFFRETDVFPEEGLMCYTFCDFFTSEIIRKEDGAIETVDTETNTIIEPDIIHFVAPYFERIAERSEIVPVIEKPGREKSFSEVLEEFDTCNWVPNSRKSFDDFELEFGIPVNGVKSIANCALNAWLKNKKYCNKGYDNQDLSKYFDKNKYHEYLNNIGTLNYIPACLEFLCGGHYSLYKTTLSGSYLAIYAYYPIATDSFFYGYLMVAFPLAEADWTLGNNKKVKLEKGGRSKVNAILELLKSLATKTYLPMLILFHNGYLERRIEHLIKEYKKSKRNSARDKIDSEWCNIIFFTEHAETSDNSFELRFSNLWRNRGKLFYGEKPFDNVDLTYDIRLGMLRKTLRFAKYFVASPGMIKAIEKTYEVNPSMGAEYLPSALVIGGPGSGKDNVAKLIQLFSDDYWAKETVVLNMASFKPPAISTPLITGADLGFEQERATWPSIAKYLLPRNIKFEGIFERILREKGDDTVIILDELNSLDVDAQGALFRVIENRKLMPLGTAEEKEVKFLIIGIMNENPKDLLTEYNLRRLIQDNKYLGVVGAHLFGELMKRIKRLREDLYYRLIRGAEITLDELDDRRFDIPILSYVFVLNELKNRIANEPEVESLVSPKKGSGGKKIKLRFKFELIAFEELMNPEIKWPGNVRQLQFVCKELYRLAYKIAVGKSRQHSTRNKKDLNLEVRVSANIVKKVLEDSVY